jgi:hypothetical protein
MTEYEILDVLQGQVDTMVSLLQWWAGITLGLLVGVHVIGKELNVYMTSLLIALYIAFTAAISFIESAHGERMKLLTASLGRLQDQGVSLTDMSVAVIHDGGPPAVVTIFTAIGFWGLFVATIGYVIYRFRKASNAD